MKIGSFCCKTRLIFSFCMSVSYHLFPIRYFSSIVSLSIIILLIMRCFINTLIHTFENKSKRRFVLIVILVQWNLYQRTRRRCSSMVKSADPYVLESVWVHMWEKFSMLVECKKGFLLVLMFSPTGLIYLLETSDVCSEKRCKTYLKYVVSK